MIKQETYFVHITLIVKDVITLKLGIIRNKIG